METLKMFRHTDVAAEVEEIEQGDGPGHQADLIPLSVLRLDLDPGEAWPSFLGRRGIAFQPDRCGRDSITVTDAARLIAERRAQELKKQQHLKVAERRRLSVTGRSGLRFTPASPGMRCLMV
jgi:hypothetical protein